MKKNLTRIAVVTLVLMLMAAGASAAVLPYGYVAKPKEIRATVSADSLMLRTGPGTGRYFAEAGHFSGMEGAKVKLLAYSYDPNNGIYWVKVEWPEGTGHTGWTGKSRFYASSFNLYDLPYESWYPGY